MSKSINTPDIILEKASFNNLEANARAGYSACMDLRTLIRLCIVRCMYGCIACGRKADAGCDGPVDVGNLCGAVSGDIHLG